MRRYREAALGLGDEFVTKYTSSVVVDEEIREEVVQIMLAHVIHLIELGLIPIDPGRRLVSALLELLEDPNRLRLENMIVEDVHEALEVLLGEKVREAAGYAPLGRSRNDHVAAALRLRLAKRTLKLLRRVLSLRETLVRTSERFLDTPFPLHTHFQPAQISTYGHYLLALEEELRDLSELALIDLKYVLRSPLGAAAGAGTSVPIERDALASSLGFEGVIDNTLYSTSSRGFVLRILHDLASLAVLYSRVATDFYLWSNPALSLIELPSHHVQTSSIMPHKRNPASVEVMRARCIEVLVKPLLASMIEAKLPTGYSLDLQEITKHVWEAFDLLEEATTVLEDLVGRAEPNRAAIEVYLRSFYCGLVEAAELASMRLGLPFRELHAKIASLLRKHGWDCSKVLEALGSELGMELSGLADPIWVLSLRSSLGSPSPAALRDSLSRAREALSLHEMRAREFEKRLEESVEGLKRRARELARGSAS
ncbi:MAG: lyase family protein [Fervidicoccaceae archaeon]